MEQFSWDAPVHTEKSFLHTSKVKLTLNILTEFEVSFPWPYIPLFADMPTASSLPILYTVVSLSEVFQSNLDIPKEKWPIFNEISILTWSQNTSICTFVKVSALPPRAERRPGLKIPNSFSLKLPWSFSSSVIYHGTLRRLYGCPLSKEAVLLFFSLLIHLYWCFPLC